MTIAQDLMQSYLEGLDDQLASEMSTKHLVINRQPRTINFCFGPVNFKRRYYQRLGFYLDQHLKISPRCRLSAYLRLMMAKLGQATTMRNAAMSLNLLFDSGISANSVMKAVHELGPQVNQLAEYSECQVEQRWTPQHLVIEGDAFEIKAQDPGQTKSRDALVHHYQIYEVVKDAGSPSGWRHINRHDFLS